MLGSRIWRHQLHQVLVSRSSQDTEILVYCRNGYLHGCSYHNFFIFMEKNRKSCSQCPLLFLSLRDKKLPETFPAPLSLAFSAQLSVLFSVPFPGSFPASLFLSRLLSVPHSFALFSSAPLNRFNKNLHLIMFPCLYHHQTQCSRSQTHTHEREKTLGAT